MVGRPCIRDYAAIVGNLCSTLFILSFRCMLFAYGFYTCRIQLLEQSICYIYIYQSVDIYSLFWNIAAMLKRVASSSN